MAPRLQRILLFIVVSVLLTDAAWASLVHFDIDPPHTHSIQILLDAVSERESTAGDLVAATA